jgi:uncharacterized protein YndB with AHSA1/START domain
MSATSDQSIISSFTILQELTIKAPRERVWQALTRDIGQWWAFRVNKEEPSTISLEPQLGGRFMERWGDDEGALWGVVTFLRKPQRLRLNGQLGMNRPVNSQYEYELEDVGGSTLLRLTHRCYGEQDPNWEQAHRQGWGTLLNTYLKRFLEQGLTHQQVAAEGQSTAAGRR